MALSSYHPVYLRAREQNRSIAYKQQMTVRQTIAEGVFASLDRLGWARCKLRGLWRVDCGGWTVEGGGWRVDCEGYISALAHNISKAVRKLGGMGPPTSAAVAERAVATP